jgi:site-specific recombinase XerD
MATQRKSPTTPAWQQRYDALVESGIAANTRRAYRDDVTRFWRWVRATQSRSPRYPVNVNLVLEYILAHLPPESNTPLKISTLKRYLASLSIAHQEQGVASPTLDPKVQLLLRRARRALTHQRPLKKAAATRSVLDAMLVTCDNSLHGVRDRALLLVGFAAGGRRRSELAALEVQQLQRLPEGYLLHIDKSKTDQAGAGFTVPVTGEAANALRTWLLRSGIRDGKVFRGILPNENLNAGLDGRSIARVVQSRAQRAGLDPKLFGAHSLRSGFITEAANQGVPLQVAMQLSGHKTLEVAQGYYRSGVLTHHPAADLLGSVRTAATNAANQMSRTGP